jgi:hypothetical protein
MTNTDGASEPVASGERFQRIDEVDAQADPASATTSKEVRINRCIDIIQFHGGETGQATTERTRHRDSSEFHRTPSRTCTPDNDSEER